MSWDVQPLTIDNLPRPDKPTYLWRDDYKCWVVADINAHRAIQRYIGHPELAYTYWCYYSPAAVVLPPEPR